MFPPSDLSNWGHAHDKENDSNCASVTVSMIVIPFIKPTCSNFDIIAVHTTENNN